MHIAKWKEPVGQGCVLNEANFTTHQQVAGVKGERIDRKRWGTGDFYGGVTNLYDCLMVGTWHCAFFQRHWILQHKEWTSLYISNLGGWGILGRNADCDKIPTFLQIIKQSLNEGGMEESAGPHNLGNECLRESKGRETAHKHCLLAVRVVSHRELENSPHGALCVRARVCVCRKGTKKDMGGRWSDPDPSLGQSADKQGEGVERMHGVMGRMVGDILSELM